MYKYLKELKGFHQGQDIYVLGSGASMNYMPKSFFYGKITVGVNRAHKFFHCKYTVVKDFHTARGCVSWLNSMEKYNSVMIATEFANKYDHKFNTNRHEYYIAPVGKWSGVIDPSLIDTDKMVNSHSTITTAIHVAYYMGAANIILCGADCGLLDAATNISEYYNEESSRSAQSMSHPYQLMNIQAMKILLGRRGCNVVSLNPFVNIGLEGHTFSLAPMPEDALWGGSPDEILKNLTK